MTESELETWMESLLTSGEAVPSSDGGWHRQRVPATAWLGEARSALHAAFPPTHPLCRQWDAIGDRAKHHKINGWGAELHEPFAHVHFEQAMGVLQAGLSIVKRGGMRSLIDGVRADTVSEVLDQAAALVSGGYVVAATVLAGGALETHLRHLCIRNNLTWGGEGSIAKYDQAISQARNAGNEFYSTTETKLISGWGGLRNDAAHEPTSFRRAREEISLMIEGIRQFIARVP